MAGEPGVPGRPPLATGGANYISNIPIPSHQQAQIAPPVYLSRNSSTPNAKRRGMGLQTLTRPIASNSPIRASANNIISNPILGGSFG